MNSKKYVKNLMDFVKEEDKRQKLTVLISAENKNKIKSNKINSSKLFDAFLSDFFAELEKENQPSKQDQISFPTAP
jgi:hypothetical protein